MPRPFLLMLALSDHHRGSCVTTCIAKAFKIEPKAVEAMLILAGEDKPSLGANFFVCKKVINALGRVTSWRKPRYQANKAGINYTQLALTLDNENVIVHFTEHLSHLEKGTIRDSFVVLNRSYLTKKPKGWWIL